MRRRLAVLVAATTSLVLVAFVVPLALLMRTVAADRAVSNATLEAESLSALVTSVDRRTLTLTLEQATAASGRPITVFLPDGTAVGSPAARSAAVELAASGRSFTAQAPGGREVFVAVQGMPSGAAVVRTFVSDAELSRGVARAWLVLGLLGFALLGLSLLVADRLARSLVRSARDLSAVSHRLAAGRLDARARPSDTPELRDVASALNHLAGRIEELLAAEREAAADLSHSLRTPLTALRLELESLRDPAEAARAGASVDALERAVSRIIADTRRPVRADAGCDAAEVVAERVRFWAVLAEDQDRPLTAPDPAGPLPVPMSRDTLTTCVDALLGNVFAHTPEGTGFAVGLEPGVRLTVADDGPGFGTADPLERGVSGAGSSGLGLDIVRRAAESCGGSLAIGRSETGGALVIVNLPRRAELAALAGLPSLV